MPEKELPLTDPATGWLNHPFESAARAGVTVTVGVEASNLNAPLVASAVFPALSMQLPLTVALVVSGPAYVVGVHEAMPETELPDTLAATGWLYQSPESGRRGRDTETIGPEASYLNTALSAVAVLPALSVQLPRIVLLSMSGPAYVIGAVHEAMLENAVPVVVAMTGWVYQPLVSGARDRSTDADGFDSSYWNWALVPVPVLPAVSVQLPATVAFSASGPE
jgi:hypothetical protein